MLVSQLARTTAVANRVAVAEVKAGEGATGCSGAGGVVYSISSQRCALHTSAELCDCCTLEFGWRGCCLQRVSFRSHGAHEHKGARSASHRVLPRHSTTQPHAAALPGAAALRSARRGHGARDSAPGGGALHGGRDCAAAGAHRGSGEGAGGVA